MSRISCAVLLYVVHECTISKLLIATTGSRTVCEPLYWEGGQWVRRARLVSKVAISLYGVHIP